MCEFDSPLVDDQTDGEQAARYDQCRRRLQPKRVKDEFLGVISAEW